MFLVQLIISGLANGCIYASIALGTSLIYRATGVLNFGHGELCMIGAFFGYVFRVNFQFSYLVSLLLAMILSGMLGLLLDWVVFRRILRSSPIIIVMATIAVGFTIKGAARLNWGKDCYPFPPILESNPIQIGNVLLVPQDLAVIIISVILMVIFFTFFQYTRLGKMMRATSQNQVGAALVGISVKRIFSYIWASGAAVGSVAGVLIAPITSLYPDMGGKMMVKAFAAMVLGGFGNIPGAIAGGMIMGIVENIVGGYITTMIMDISSFLVIMLILTIKPEGLFATKTYKKV